MSSSPFRRALTTVAAAAAASTVLSLGCGSPTPVNAPTESAPPPEVAAEPNNAPLLWRVEGAEAPSYLFGTVHLGASLADVGPAVPRALSAAETFISEANLDAIDQVEMAKMAVLPAGASLESQLGKTPFAELVRLLSPSLTGEQLNKLRPWVAYTSVLQVLYGDGRGSIDAVLTKSAESAGKTMVYLESWRFQLEMLAGQIDANDVKGILDPASKDRSSTEAIMAAYKRGDFAAMTELIAGPAAVADDPAEFKALFADRNRAWVPVLSEHLRRGGAFVAVGAGHFAGDVGLLALLRAEGFVVTRVAVNPQPL